MFVYRLTLRPVYMQLCVSFVQSLNRRVCSWTCTREQNTITIEIGQNLQKNVLLHSLGFTLSNSIQSVTYNSGKCRRCIYYLSVCMDGIIIRFILVETNVRGNVVQLFKALRTQSIVLSQIGKIVTVDRFSPISINKLTVNNFV